MKVALYLRVSTKRQTDISDGKNSFLIQNDTLVNYCNANGYTITGVYKDSDSGRNLDVLPNFKKMMRDSGNSYGYGKKFDMVIFYDITRFSRNTLQGLLYLDKLSKKNIKVYSVMDECGYSTFSEKNVFRIILSRSENESDTISFRSKQSVAFRRARGDKLGNPPYGMESYRDNIGRRLFRSNLNEQKTISQIQNMKYLNKSNKDIASILNNNNNKKRKRDWSESSVTGILKKYPIISTKKMKHSLRNIISNIEDNARNSKKTRHNSRNDNIII